MPSDNELHFFISYAIAFLVFALIAKWYLWPAMRDRAPTTALSPLLLYACLRVNGLMFLMPGLVSPDLPKAFAVPTAYGDLTAALLALIALACLRLESAAATPCCGSSTWSGSSISSTPTSRPSGITSIRSISVPPIISPPSTCRP